MNLETEVNTLLTPFFSKDHEASFSDTETKAKLIKASTPNQIKPQKKASVTDHPMTPLSNDFERPRHSTIKRLSQHRAVSVFTEQLYC